MRQLLALFLLWIAIVHLSCVTTEDEMNVNNGMSLKENLKSLPVKGLVNLQSKRKLSNKQKSRKKKDKAKKKKRLKRKNKRNNKRRNKSRKLKRKKKTKLSKMKKTKKSKKKTNRQKTGQRKKSKRRNSRSKVTKQQSCIEGCPDLMISMMKLQRKQYTFLKQFNRIVRGQEQAQKKGLKKDNFDSNTTDGPLNLLISAGGGNKSELSCAGSKTNKAAIMMKNLTAKLEKCKTSIASKCNLTTLFVKIKQEWRDCNTSMVSFKTASDACLNMTAKEACDCFNTTAVQALKTKIDACNGTEMNGAALKDLKAKKDCMSGYGACRASGEMIRKVLAVCQFGGPTEKDLKEKVGKILKNKKANEAVLNKTKALASGVRQMNRRSTSRNTISISGMTFDLSLCPMWTKGAMLWLGALDADVTTDISTTGLAIASINPTCTAADKATLMAVQAKGEAVAKKVEKKVDMVQKILQKATGSTISPAAAETLVESTTVAATVTKSIRRRRMLMDHVLQRQ